MKCISLISDLLCGLATVAAIGNKDESFALIFGVGTILLVVFTVFEFKSKKSLK